MRTFYDRSQKIEEALSADGTETVREAAGAGDEPVALHRTEVATLDALVFVHPNWWGMPARRAHRLGGRRRR